MTANLQIKPGLPRKSFTFPLFLENCCHSDKLISLKHRKVSYLNAIKFTSFKIDRKMKPAIQLTIQQPKAIFELSELAQHYCSWRRFRLPLSRNQRPKADHSDCLCVSQLQPKIATAAAAVKRILSTQRDIDNTSSSFQLEHNHCLYNYRCLAIEKIGLE